MRSPTRRSLHALVASLLGFALAAPGVATNLTVDTRSDADAVDGFCSLREAILAANTDTVRNECPAGAGADRIDFALTLPTSIPVTADLPRVTESLAIRGPGADQLGIDGQDLHRLFDFESATGGALYLVEDLSILRGFADATTGPPGGGAYLGPGDHAVFSRVVFEDNRSSNAGGGFAVSGAFGVTTIAEFEGSTLITNVAEGPAGGGGMRIESYALVSLSDCAVIGNRADAEFGSGGGILVQRSTLELRRTTVSDNTASDIGGGLYSTASQGGVLLHIEDSTIYDNHADDNADGIGDAGGVYVASDIGQSTTLEMKNSIVAGNHDPAAPAHPDLFVSGTVVLGVTGFNLIGTNTDVTALFPTGAPNAAGDYAGTIAAPIDPLLRPLALNNGPTLNHRPDLDAASQVIDHGSCPGSLADQRGHGDPATGLRIFDNPTVPNSAATDGCDIGSVERGASPILPDAIFGDGFENGCTLRWSAEES